MFMGLLESLAMRGKLMELEKGHQKHKYCLIVADDMKGCAQRIELNALNPLPAMSLVQRSFSERDIELYEDEHALGLLRCDSQGFWTVLPSSLSSTEHEGGTF